MISLEEALRYVLSGCVAGEPKELTLADASGCVLAQDVVSAVPVPPFDNSAVDGYAVRSGDTVNGRSRIAVVDAIMAGRGSDRCVQRGQAVRIMTGAPLPRGADAVCMLEHTMAEPGSGSVLIEHPVPAGANVRKAGEDVPVGLQVFSSGTVLGPAHVGVLAGLGMGRVRARPRPRVGVLSTGDELVAGPTPPPPGGIWDSNRHMLIAQVRLAGCRAVDLGIVRDDLAALTMAISDGAMRCDALVLSGGVSVGDRDMVKVALETVTQGAMRWMQVAVKPAKPLAFGVVAGSAVPVFGLPGNPVAAMISFELFARPGLRRMAGHARLARPRVGGKAAVDLVRRPDGRTHFVQVTVSRDREGVWASSLGGPHSHRLTTMTRANALAVLPDGTGARAGDPVDLLLLDAEDLAYSEEHGSEEYGA